MTNLNPFATQSHRPHCDAEQDEHTDASCLECAQAEREAGIVIGLGLAMAWGPLLQCTGFKRKEAKPRDFVRLLPLRTGGAPRGANMARDPMRSVFINRCTGASVGNAAVADEDR